jgi:membrane fusion protein, heavy metal efflux system
LLTCLCCGGRKPGTDLSDKQTDSIIPPGLVVLPSDSPKLRLIKVEPVQLLEVPIDEVTVAGKIEVNPNRVSRVVLPVTGRVVSVFVKLGDHVNGGDPLLALESPDADAAESAYIQAEASLTQAKAALVKAQADFDRASDLYQHNAIAKKEVLSAENSQTQAKAAVEQAEAVKEQASRRLGILGLKTGSFGQKVIIRAPISGKVLELGVVPGEYRNDTSAPLMTIADLSTVWVSANVPESYIRRVDVGEHVDIMLLAYPGETFKGRVRRIADQVDPQSRTVKVQAELDNPAGKLLPEMYGNIRHVEGMQPEPVLPAGAIVQGDGNSYVYVQLEPGKFQKTNIQTGRRFGGVIPIVSGVKPGDRVVVDGAMLLQQ